MKRITLKVLVPMIIILLVVVLNGIFGQEKSIKRAEDEVNKPQIVEGMIPVYYENGEWKKADTTNTDVTKNGIVIQKTKKDGQM